MAQHDVTRGEFLNTLFRENDSAALGNSARFLPLLLVSSEPFATMDEKAAYELIGARAYYRPSGVATAGQLADMITEALVVACDGGARAALVNIVAMNGFESPGPSYRRWLIRRWAVRLAGRLRVGVVARREHICPEKTGLLVAAEEGLQGSIFEAEADALAWLNDTDVKEDAA